MWVQPTRPQQMSVRQSSLGCRYVVSGPAGAPFIAVLAEIHCPMLMPVEL